MNGIQTHHLRYGCSALTTLANQANWKCQLCGFVIIPVNDEDEKVNKSLINSYISFFIFIIHGNIINPHNDCSQMACLPQVWVLQRYRSSRSWVSILDKSEFFQASFLDLPKLHTLLWWSSMYFNRKQGVDLIYTKKFTFWSMSHLTKLYLWIYKIHVPYCCFYYFFRKSVMQVLQSSKEHLQFYSCLQ